ncbi:DUF2637 domain-containing protein [Streptomyces hydrogenans]|uniref:DUF2637 domain-containing protein n=1 Tax=Streptomyces hydrogenans TaxID=1873719 RepID=UPI00365E4B57
MIRLNTQEQVEAAERTLRWSWVIVAGVILFSVFTVTPLVERSTPEGWEWSAPILPLVVDVAVVISIRVDAIVARLGGSTSGWPVVLRVLTGGTSVALNIGHSALKGDLVGVGVHMAAPVVLIVVAEASLKWRREIAAATARIERERAAERERQESERKEREERSRADAKAAREAEQAERERQEQLDREREKDVAAERERQREHDARLAHAAREHEAKLARDAAAQQAAAEQAARDDAARQRQEEWQRADSLRREQEAKAAREQKAKEAAQAAEQAQKAAQARQIVSAPRPAVSAAVSTPRPVVSAAVSTPAPETAHDAQPEKKKLPEHKALEALAEAVREGRSQRQIVALTGWSTGWVAKHCQALTDTKTPEEAAA